MKAIDTITSTYKYNDDFFIECQALKEKGEMVIYLYLFNKDEKTKANFSKLVKEDIEHHNIKNEHDLIKYAFKKLDANKDYISIYKQLYMVED